MKRIKVYRNKASRLMEYVPMLLLIEDNPGYWMLDNTGRVQTFMTDTEFLKNQEHWELVDNDLIVDESISKLERN